jgi:hypothetical protein
MPQLQDAGGFVHALLDLGQRHFFDLQAVSHVVEHAHVRVQRVVLEHHGNVALGRFQRVDHARTDGNVATRNVFQPCHHAQQRGLAAARRTDDDDELAICHLGVQTMDDRRGFGAVAVGLYDVAK